MLCILLFIPILSILYFNLNIYLLYAQLGDLSVVLDDKVKELVCELSGKDEYEFGDLSIQIDKKVKESVASFCGKDKYEFGDLSKEGENIYIC